MSDKIGAALCKHPPEVIKSQPVLLEEEEFKEEQLLPAVGDYRGFPGLETFIVRHTSEQLILASY